MLEYGFNSKPKKVSVVTEQHFSGHGRNKININYVSSNESNDEE